MPVRERRASRRWPCTRLRRSPNHSSSVRPCEYPVLSVDLPGDISHGFRVACEATFQVESRFGEFGALPLSPIWIRCNPSQLRWLQLTQIIRLYLELLCNSSTPAEAIRSNSESAPNLRCEAPVPEWMIFPSIPMLLGLALLRTRAPLASPTSLTAQTIPGPGLSHKRSSHKSRMVDDEATTHLGEELFAGSGDLLFAHARKPGLVLCRDASRFAIPLPASAGTPFRWLHSGPLPSLGRMKLRALPLPDLAHPLGLATAAHEEAGLVGRCGERGLGSWGRREGVALADGGEADGSRLPAASFLLFLPLASI